MKMVVADFVHASSSSSYSSSSSPIITKTSTRKRSSSSSSCSINPIRIRSSLFHRRILKLQQHHRRSISLFRPINPNNNNNNTLYSIPSCISGNSFACGSIGTGGGGGSLTASMFLPENPVLNDVLATAISGGVALSLLQFWGEIGKRGIFDQKLTRKLVHISIGLVFMLHWPLFSYGRQAAVLAALVPGINIIRMLLVGFGIWKEEAMVKSMSRYGDHRELLKGPLYYASTITFAAMVYWRTSPIAIAAICNLCAGDGLADVVGRRLGNKKLPYNRNKSYAGSIAMAAAGFLASVGYMHYFSLFGYVEESLGSVFGFLIVSLVTAVVESLPISTQLDDNLTVPLTSILVGSLIF